MSNGRKNEFFYCHSPKLQAFLRSKGQRYICVGLNEHTLKKFWQFRRSGALHRLLDEWQANNPNR